jgi:AcrR family transcriptional regulator
MSGEGPCMESVKERIQKAFLKLLMDEPLQALTIKRLTQEAQIHRSTFYVYYINKEMLYEEMMDDLLFELNLLIQPIAGQTLEETKRDYFEKNQPLGTAIQFLQHIEEKQSLYRVFIHDTKFQQNFAQIVSDAIYQSDFLPRIFTQHIGYGAIGLVIEWLKHKSSYTIDEVALYLSRIVIQSMLYNQQSK